MKQMRLISSLFLIIAFFLPIPANAKNLLDEEHALDVMVSQIQKDKLYDSWTSTDCLSFITEEKTKIYFDFAIHEKHGGACPGDPGTAPVVDRFRVNRSTHKIQWLEPAEGKYLSYGAVLKVKREMKELLHSHRVE
ncbi:MAG: hypothetical protein HZC44_07920 [Geobacter sp.]|nr:hypothetical protein [Geobacter sp.]